jgi:CarboxypepD_reg-like domain/TonB-dependent Receptor Plug Domain
MKKTNSLIIILLLFAGNSFGQFGEIRGTVTDKASGLALPGATITWKANETIKGTITNEKGEYVIKPLVPGIYDLEISFVTYKKQPYKSISVSAEKATYVDVALLPDNELPEVIIKWVPPMIDKGSTATMTTYSTPEIAQSVERDVVSMVTQTAGVFQKEEGGSINVRGSREANTLFVVDGIKMTGPFTIPKSAIAEISVLTGGIPAQFGDATGGVVIITTKSHRMK